MFSVRPRIDCHTHIVSPAIRDEYFQRAQGFALVMQFPPSLMENPQCIQTVLSDPRLFLCPCVDLHRPIPPQLSELEPHLDEWKVVGLKVYLTYQKGRACDEKMIPIYEFARQHQLAVTFHTGLCSLVLPSENDMEGSQAKYIAQAAQRFPEVNFIIAHMDDPRFMECAALLHRHKNLFTDVSGAYETGTKEGNDVQGAIATFRQALLSQPDLWKQFLYGTDFCPPLNLGQLDEYDETIEKIFPPETFDAIYYQNCLRAFPRLGRWLSL